MIHRCLLSPQEWYLLIHILVSSKIQFPMPQWSCLLFHLLNSSISFKPLYEEWRLCSSFTEASTPAAWMYWSALWTAAAPGLPLPCILALITFSLNCWFKCWVPLLICVYLEDKTVSNWYSFYQVLKQCLLYGNCSRFSSMKNCL